MVSRSGSRSRSVSETAKPAMLPEAPRTFVLSSKLPITSCADMMGRSEASVDVQSRQARRLVSLDILACAIKITHLLDKAPEGEVTEDSSPSIYYCYILISH